jgi:ribonuclease P protein component
VTTSTPRATFRKHERLTGRDAFNAVVKQGSAINEAPFRLVGLFTKLDSVSPAQIAFAIPKRYVRQANQRNHIRRLTREVYRQDKEQWYAALRAANKQCAWLLIYQSSQTLAFADVRIKLSLLMGRWLKKNLPTTSDTPLPS